MADPYRRRGSNMDYNRGFQTPTREAAAASRLFQSPDDSAETTLNKSISAAITPNFTLPDDNGNLDPNSSFSTLYKRNQDLLLSNATKFANLSLEGGKEDYGVENAIAQALLAFTPIVAGYMMGGDRGAASGAAAGLIGQQTFQDVVERQDAKQELQKQKDKAILLEEITRRGKAGDELALKQAEANARAEQIDLKEKKRAEYGTGGTRITIKGPDVPFSREDRAVMDSYRQRANQLSGFIGEMRKQFPEEIKKGFFDEAGNVQLGNVGGAVLDSISGAVFGAGANARTQMDAFLNSLTAEELRVMSGAAATDAEREFTRKRLSGEGLLPVDYAAALSLVARYRNQLLNNMQLESDYLIEARQNPARAAELAKRQNLNYSNTGYAPVLPSSLSRGEYSRLGIADKAAFIRSGGSVVD